MAQVGDAFVKFSAQVNTASFNRAKQEINNTAREIKTKLRKETSEAKDALELLSRKIGLELPRSVQKFLASSASLRPVLAGAFNATIIGTFGVAIAKLGYDAAIAFKEFATGAEAAKKFRAEAGAAPSEVEDEGFPPTQDDDDSSLPF